MCGLLIKDRACVVFTVGDSTCAVSTPPAARRRRPPPAARRPPSPAAAPRRPPSAARRPPITKTAPTGTDSTSVPDPGWLGHSSSKTTEMYTHVSTKNLQQIRSPFDDL